MKKVSIVIPTWNGESLLAKNLQKVIDSSDEAMEIIIVDDGSTDGTAKLIRKNFKKNSKVKLVSHTKNRGFAVSVNTGFRYAKGELVCLLNNDVLPTKGYLKESLKYFKNDDCFGVVFHEKGYGPATAKFDGYLNHSSRDENTPCDVSLWVSGGSSIIDREKYWEVGGMDEKLFAPFYWEDVDLGYGAWKLGYKIYWSKNSVVVHKHESTINSSNFRTKYIARIKERNQLLFIWKNISSKKMLTQHFVWLLKRLLSHPGYLRVVVQALVKTPILLRSRKTRLKNSKVSDEAIFNVFS